ncbi:MAG: hypothetical protein AAF493_28120 [Pseudomonadota bacterium]
MAKHVVLVLSEPTEGQETEFNRWYEQTHIDEVLSSADFASGQRFELTHQAGPDCPNRYLALYEVEAPDAATAVKQLDDSRSAREQSNSINKRTAALWVFSPIGDKHVRR